MSHPLLAGRYRLTLSSGREIELATLEQQPSYLNVLSGYPTRSLNQRLMQSHMRMAEERQARLSLRLKPILIEPSVTQISPHLQSEGLEENNPDPCEALPPVLSVAVFESGAAGSVEVCSSTLVVWYQDQWGLPTLPAIEALRELDWAAHAQDWTW